MTLEEENKILRRVIQDTFWMARRYAHGRHTYVPSIIRENYKIIKELGIIIKPDTTIKPATDREKGEFGYFPTDYLDDINE